MSSLFTASEIALARLGLAELSGADLEVVGEQRFVFGAAVIDGLGAQRLDAHLELVERYDTAVMGAVLDADARPDRVATLCPRADTM
jgi:hypothetical protein